MGRLKSQSVDLIYDAAVGAAPWSQVLQSFAAAVECEHASMFARDFGARRVTLLETHNHERIWLDRFVEKFAWSPGAGRPFKSLAPNHVGWVQNDPDAHKFPIYLEYSRPQGFAHMLLGVAGRLGGQRVIMTAQRRRGEKPFPDKMAAVYTAHARHISRALRLRERLADAGMSATAGETSWQQSPTPVILLDARGRVAGINAAARRLLAASCGLTILHDRLTTPDPLHTQALECLLSVAVNPLAAMGSDTLTLPAPDGQMPLRVQACPINTGHQVLWLGGPRIAAIVFITRQGGSVLSIDQALHARFGLTPGEAKLAAALSRGENLKDAADALGISYGTARQRLLVVFDKTGTHAQGALVQRVLETTKAQAP